MEALFEFFHQFEQYRNGNVSTTPNSTYQYPNRRIGSGVVDTRPITNTIELLHTSNPSLPITPDGPTHVDLLPIIPVDASKKRDASTEELPGVTAAKKSKGVSGKAEVIDLVPVESKPDVKKESKKEEPKKKKKTRKELLKDMELNIKKQYKKRRTAEKMAEERTRVFKQLARKMEERKCPVKKGLRKLRCKSEKNPMDPDGWCQDCREQWKRKLGVDDLLFAKGNRIIDGDSLGEEDSERSEEEEGKKNTSKEE
jgi:hypothetical protein